MRSVAVAITTTGSVPARGARISQIAAVELVDGRSRTELHLPIAIDEATASDGKHLPYCKAYAALVTSIDDSPLIAHDVYDLHRFLRAECKRNFILHDIERSHPSIDTWALAKERFPRQRHGLTAVARKLGIEANPMASDALEVARLVALVARKLSVLEVADLAPRPATVEMITTAVAAPMAEGERSESDVPSAPARPVLGGLGTWVGRIWQSLIGRA